MRGGVKRRGKIWRGGGDDRKSERKMEGGEGGVARRGGG